MRIFTNKNLLFYRIVLGLLFLLPLFSVAQTTFDWNSIATSGLWNTGANWGGAAPAGSEIIQFNNNVQTTMTNDLSATNRHKIFIISSATTNVFSLNSSTVIAV